MPKDQEISYPIIWTYAIIGEDKSMIENAIFEIMPHKYEITQGLTSKNQKYITLRVNINVHTQEMRDEIFQSLSKHPAVKMVL